MKLSARTHSSGLPLIVLLGFLLLSLFASHYPALLSGFTYLQHDEIDSRLNHFILEHGFMWLMGERPAFWNGETFYPFENSLALGDSLIGVLPFYAVIRLVGVSVELAFQVWLILMSILSFFSARYLFQVLGSTSSLASSFGACLFCIASPRLSHMGHAQLLTVFYSLLFLSACVVAFREGAPLRRRTALFSAALFLALQFLSSPYLGWFLCFTTGIAIAISLLFAEFRGRLFKLCHSFPLTLFLAASLFVGLTFPVIVQYQTVASKVGYRSFTEVAYSLPSLQMWLYQGPTSVLYGPLSQWLLFQGNLLEQELRLGFGVITTVLFLYSVFLFWRKSVIRLLILTSAVLFILVTDFPGDFFLWDYVYLSVPGAGAIRGVSRIVLLLSIPLVLSITLLFDHLLANRKFLLVLLLGSFCLLEQLHTLHSYNRFSIEKNVSRMTKNVSRCREKSKAFFFYQAEGKYDAERYHLDAMWASLKAKRATVNGYSGNIPQGWELKAVSPQSEVKEEELLLSLRAWSEKNSVKFCVIRKDNYAQFKIGSISPASSNPFARKRQAGQEPHGGRSPL